MGLMRIVECPLCGKKFEQELVEPIQKPVFSIRCQCCTFYEIEKEALQNLQNMVHPRKSDLQKSLIRKCNQFLEKERYPYLIKQRDTETWGQSNMTTAHG